MKVQDLAGTHRATSYCPGQATAGTVDTWPVFTAPRACKIVGIRWTPAAALSGAATNNPAIGFQNKGQAGVGTTAVTSVKTYDSGTDSVAHDSEEFTLSSTAANLVMADGDVLVMVRTVNGTGLAQPDGLVTVSFQY